MAPPPHAVVLPRWTLGLRAAQLVLAVLIMGLVAAGTTSKWLSWMRPAYGVALFTCSATMLMNLYIILSSTKMPDFYVVWVVLGMDGFMAFFWLVSCCLLAGYARNHIPPSDWAFFLAFYDSSRDPGYRLWQASAAAAGLAGLQLVLFVVTLAMLSLHLARHRTSHRPSHLTSGATGVRYNMQTISSPVPVQPFAPATYAPPEPMAQQPEDLPSYTHLSDRRHNSSSGQRTMIPRQAPHQTGQPAVPDQAQALWAQTRPDPAANLAAPCSYGAASEAYRPFQGQ